MNNSVNLIISGNLTGFSRFFTSADANVIYDEAKFDFDYRNFVTFLDTDDRAYAISFEKNVIAVSLVVRSLDSFRRPGILVFSILMHRKQKVLYKLMPQSKTVLFDMLDEIYEAFMSHNFVNGMLNQNGVVLKQDYYTEILNNYELVSDNEQKDINATLNMATRNKRAGYVVPENGDMAPYLETPCRKSYSGYHHVFISEKAPANINEGIEETERYDVVVTNTKEMLREVSLKDKIPTLPPTNAYEEMFNQDYTFEDILSGKEPKISICPHGDGYAITYHFPKKTKTVQFVLKDGLDEIPWGKSLTLGYTIDGKIVNPIIASTYTFKGEELGCAIKLSIRTGNYCIRKGFETLNLSNSNDKFTVQVEKTQEYSTIFEDSLIKSFIFRSANRDEVIVENVREKLEVKLAGKLDEWECTIKTNGYEDYKCSLSDLRNKTVLNFIPKQSSKNILQQKQQKQQKKEEKGGASLAAQQLNLADDKINKLLRKYAPVGIAAAVFVALVLVLVFVPGLWTSEGNEESVSLKTTDSVEVQAKIVLVDVDGDLIERKNIKKELDDKFNGQLRVVIDGNEQNQLNTKFNQ